MNSLIAVLALLQQTGDRIPGDLLLLDSGMAGLFDAYLEAVPECPARDDTPVRFWLLDLAGSRASAGLRNAVRLLRRTRDSDLRSALKSYLWTCSAYLDSFSDVREMYRAPAPPDSAGAMEAEDGLFERDEAWLDAGSALFALLAEEGWR